eukprot:3609308-Rhodomonas_salina.2
MLRCSNGSGPRAAGGRGVSTALICAEKQLSSGSTSRSRDPESRRIPSALDLCVEVVGDCSCSELLSSSSE